MARCGVKAVAAAVLAILSPQVATAQTPATAAPASHTAFDRRAAELVDLFAGKIAYADYFAPSFQAAVPETQFKAINASLLAQYGKPLSVDRATSDDGRSGTVLLRFEKSVATIALVVDGDAGAKVSGLRLTGFAMADDSFAQVAAEIADRMCS